MLLTMAEFGKLRKIGCEELDQVLAWRNASSVRENMYNTHIISREEHMRWWDAVTKVSDQKYFMYEYQGVALGVVGFTKIDLSNKNSSWAFYASPDAKKGTGTKMEYLVLEHAFNVLNLHKLYCEVLSFNSAVIKLHQKFGFKVEGILRDQYLRDGEFVDIYRLGLLATEWVLKAPEMHRKLEKLLGN